MNISLPILTVMNSASNKPTLVDANVELYRSFSVDIKRLGKWGIVGATLSSGIDR